MKNETKRFVNHVFDTGEGTLSELLTADYTFVNNQLGAFYDYGGPGSNESFQRVEVQDGHRSGLLTQGSFLATHARPNSSSPIHRGLIVRERILCQKLPPPPPGVNADPPDLDPSLTTRERYKAHSDVQPCVDCHRLIDPIVFAIENFDGIGRTLDDDSVHPIDAKGALIDTPSSNGEFEGTQKLGQHLAASPDAFDCLRSNISATPTALTKTQSELVWSTLFSVILRNPVATSKLFSSRSLQAPTLRG